MRKRLTILLALAVFLLTGMSAYAVPDDFGNLNGKPSKGALDISVETFQDIGGTLIETPGMVRIRAGEKTSYIPIITNNGQTAPMRLRIFAQTKSQKVNILKYCYGMTDVWDYRDGWFYYRGKFHRGDSVQICKGFAFPDEWRWRESNVLGITIEAEVVADDGGGKTFHSPKTGDDSNLLPYVLAVAASLIVIVGLARRKEDGEEDI